MANFLFPSTKDGAGALSGTLVGQNASQKTQSGGGNQWLGVLAQIGGALASAWGGSYFGGATAAAGGGATSGSPLWSAGTTARFMSQGGQVRGKNTATNVDSVPTVLADGEYVMPSHVVDTLGLGYMERMRSDPSSVLNESIKIESKQETKKSPPSLTNVYVVSKDNVPSSISQNDIIVAVEDNIARNGSMKKLIKQVANE